MRTGNIMIGAVAKRISSKFNEGDRVKIAKEYGGGTGKVVQVVGGFVVVKTKRGDESYHSSDLKVISGIGAVKKPQYNREALNLLDMLQTVDRKIKDLKGVTVYATPWGNWAVSRKGKGLFMMQGKLLSEDTIEKYGLR